MSINTNDPNMKPTVGELVTHIAEDVEIRDVAAEYAQKALEFIKSADIFHEVPVIKTVLAAGGMIQSVRDHLLLKKLAGFLTGLAETTQWQRQDMVSRLEADPAYNRKVGTHVIELLDRIDSHRKPVMVSRAFAAYALGKIDLMKLHRLIACIERLPSHDIDAVRKVAAAVGSDRQALKNIDTESIYAMISAGLAHIESGFGGSGLEVTDTCHTFLNLNMDVEN